MNYFTHLLVLRKLRLNFKFLKMRAGSGVMLCKYEPLLEKLDPFGLRVGNLNLKKLRLNRFGLVLLKMVRRLNRLFYKKTVLVSEVSYNFLFNEKLSDNKDASLSIGVNKSVLNSNRLGTYSGIIYFKSDLFRVYVFRLLAVKNIASNIVSLFGYFGTSRLRFNVGSIRIYNSIASFEFVKKGG